MLACGRPKDFPPRVICRTAFVLALCAACVLRAQTPPAAARPEITADRQVIQLDSREAIMQGNARLTDGTLLLLADEIRFNESTGEATATGRISLTRGDLRLLADRLVYNTQTGTFQAESIRLGSHPFFIEGFSAAGTRDEITVQKARASYGEPGPWQPTINAATIVYAPGKILSSENVTLGIGHTQPVPIPRFNYSLGAPLIGTASLNGGYRRSLGVFAEAALHAPIRPGLWLGADVGVYTQRGVMIGPSGRYADAQAPDQRRGFFRSGYISDHGNKGFDLLDRPIPERRAFAEWQHRQVLAPQLTLTAQANWWRDSEVVRDFRPRAFFPVQEPDTFAETTYTGANYFISAFTRLQPNSFHGVQERLPEIRFDLLPLALPSGFYHRLNASAAVLREDPVGPGTTLRSDRLDGYYALFRPITPREWFAFTPVVGGRVTHYANTRGAARAGDYTRVLGEAGFDAALRSSGTFAYQNPRWKIDGLRHLLTPRVSYRYIPEADRGRSRIPQIDNETFSTYLQPLGLGDVRNLDDLHATNTLRFAIDNILQTRDGESGTRDLLAFNIANDFRFKRRPGERDVSAIHTELAVMPASWLQVDLYQSFEPSNQRLREFNSGITVRDGRFWSLRFGNNFLRNELQDYVLDGRVRLNERLEALTRLHYDARKRRFNEQSYGISQNLGNTWLISYVVNLYSGRRRESNFGFNIQVDTVRF